MEKKLMFLASFMLVVLVKNSEGIQCYECTSYDSGCDDPINSELSQTDCGSDVSCYKTETETTVFRGCHTSKETERCSTADILGVCTETCYCNTDGCNPAATTPCATTPAAMTPCATTPAATTKLSTGLLVFVSLAYILCRVF